MTAIGIIANPMSGKDIRRLVSHATVIDNNEKINIIERVVIGAQSMGITKVILMPELHNMAYRAVNALIKRNELQCQVEVMDYYMYGTVEDTEKAARLLNGNPEVGCIVVLGGDGTNRAAAKFNTDTPMVSISTGTNNVYPEWIEGTVAGMAAGLAALGSVDCKSCIRRQKRIEIYKEGELKDIALIDAVLSTDPIVGARAIWKSETIAGVMVTRAHPASTGFSSLVGVQEIIEARHPYGGLVRLGQGEGYRNILAPIAPGVLERVSASPVIRIEEGKIHRLEATERGTLALDGEREIVLRKGDVYEFKITRNGPLQVHSNGIVTQAQREGKFILSGEKENLWQNI